MRYYSVRAEGRNPGRRVVGLGAWAIASPLLSPDRDMESFYLLRYGAMGRMAPACWAEGRALQRGDRVVVATARGVELAEILAPVARAMVPDEVPTRILRDAAAGDLADASRHQGRLADWLRRCEAVVAEVAPGLDVVDAEVLLDGSSVVAYVLGELPEDLPAVRAAIRMRHDLDLQLEPLGFDSDAAMEDEVEPEGGCGSCGVGRSGGSGCGSCAVKRRAPSRAAAGGA